MSLTAPALLGRSVAEVVEASMLRLPVAVYETAALAYYLVTVTGRDNASTYYCNGYYCWQQQRWQ